MRVPATLLLVMLLAGCAGPGNTGEPGDDAPPGLDAPWWNLGESWTIAFEQAGQPRRTTTLVNFANNTFGDPDHFWLGTSSRQEALTHVFFDDNPFLGRIHWEILSPHEKGMHSAMYAWPLDEGTTWTSPLLFGREDVLATASRDADGRISVQAEARADGSQLTYDYDPELRWFRQLVVTDADGATALRASVTDHKDSGARGTYVFLRGRDCEGALDGGRTGESDACTMPPDGQSLAFLLDVTTSGPSAVEFVAPNGTAVHRETLALGGTADKIVEIQAPATGGEWRVRYVGSVTGSITVRGIIEYKATL